LSQTNSERSKSFRIASNTSEQQEAKFLLDVFLFVFFRNFFLLTIRFQLVLFQFPKHFKISGEIEFQTTFLNVVFPEDSQQSISMSIKSTAPRMALTLAFSIESNER